MWETILSCYSSGYLCDVDVHCTGLSVVIYRMHVLYLQKCFSVEFLSRNLSQASVSYDCVHLFFCEAKHGFSSCLLTLHLYCMVPVA